MKALTTLLTTAAGAAPDANRVDIYDGFVGPDLVQDF